MTNAVPNLPPLALPPITPHAIRDELIAMIVSDLLGPAGGPEEELDHLETNGSDDAEVGATEASAPSPTAFFPNSVGMSFVVESDSKAILIKTDWGRYCRIKSATQVNTQPEQDRRKDEAWVFQPKM